MRRRRGILSPSRSRSVQAAVKPKSDFVIKRCKQWPGCWWDGTLPRAPRAPPQPAGSDRQGI